MKGEEWMGFAPEDAYWSPDGERIYFSWNPEKEPLRTDYSYDPETGEISKLSAEDKRERLPRYGLKYNWKRDEVIFVKHGNLYKHEIGEEAPVLLLDLSVDISNPYYSVGEESCFFVCDNNLYQLDFESGRVEALTLFKQGSEKPKKEEYENEQEEWLYRDQLELYDVLKQKKEKEEIKKREKEELEPDLPLEIYTGESRAFGYGISGDKEYITFVKLKRNSKEKNAKMPRYLTKTGFTESENVRAKVGYPYGSMELGIYNRKADTVYYVDITGLPGIYEHMVYEEEQTMETREEPREVYMSVPVWNEIGTKAVVNIRSTDNKDRWIAMIDLDSGKLNLVDRQRDDAWIAGPGIGWSTSSGTLGWINDHSLFFQSEESGYSHLYTYDLQEGKKTALTKGNFEIYDSELSLDKEYFYFHSNEEHYGERHFYRINVEGGEKTRITFRTGRNDVQLSPDEKYMLVRHSYASEPWELQMAELDVDNCRDIEYEKLTDSYGKEFKDYDWRIPEFIRFPASDGAMVPARLYRPEEEKKNGAAVIFVHGAGYLQNAHKWWSSYYREYMFHNFLVDNGYTVLDMDYRASAGYGRNWRTAIYRHMGGKDLSDNVDGAGYLVTNEDIDPERIGIYGGSYGGFMTLMAMFTSPGTFAAGAALRPVTDWAHYSHGYTSNILNTPVEDSLAYRRSSPIYYANGLEGHLLMCHGMVDDNVHFQDVVRLSQRLIELQKDNWELAFYPVEAHSFKEWTSWLDEYRRIYEVFEGSLLVGKGQ